MQILEAHGKFIIVAQSQSSFVLFFRDDSVSEPDSRRVGYGHSATQRSKYKFLQAFDHQRDLRTFGKEMPDTPI